MGKLYQEKPESVNGRRHDLPDPDTLINDLRLHPALARRKNVSKGAREVFAWIMALAFVHGIDNPTTPWLAEATGDGPRQVARALAELEDLGTLRVLGDGHNRRLKIAEHMVPAKDGVGNHDRYDTVAAWNLDENVIVPGDSHDRNSSVPDGNDDRNGRVAVGNHDENVRDSRGRVGISESQKEFKSPDSETPSLVFPQKLCQEERKKAQETWELFQGHPKNGSVREYEGLLLRCTKIGREECFDIAVLQARMSQDKKTLEIPIAYIRRIITTHLLQDRDAVLCDLEQAHHEYETPAQRQEIDARERQAAADKAAHSAPPAPKVAEMMSGLSLGMPGGPSAKPRSGVNGGAGIQTPPSPPRPDTAGAAPVPIDADILVRLSPLSPFDRDQVRSFAEALAQAEDAATMRFPYASVARKNLISRHLRAALDQWEQKQARRPKLKSPEELIAAIRSWKMVCSKAAPGDRETP